MIVLIMIIFLLGTHITLNVNCQSSGRWINVANLRHIQLISFLDFSLFRTAWMRKWFERVVITEFICSSSSNAYMSVVRKNHTKFMKCTDVSINAHKRRVYEIYSSVIAPRAIDTHSTRLYGLWSIWYSMFVMITSVSLFFHWQALRSSVRSAQFLW